MQDLSTLNPSFFDEQLSEEFLSEINDTKDPVQRIISWLVILKIIPNNKKEALISFRNLLAKYDKTFEWDHSNITIDVDVDRSIVWFMKNSQKCNLPEKYLENSTEYLKRILWHLSRLIKPSDNLHYEYRQGFDRFVGNTYLLSLCFVHQLARNYKSSLRLFAEVISLHLTRRLIDLADSYFNPLRISETQLFVRLNGLMNEHFPNSSKILSDSNLSTFHFSVRWFLLLYADEHDFSNCLLLWDHLILRSQQPDEFQNYMDAIFLRHFEQIPVNRNCYISTIQTFRNWDMQKLLYFKPYFPVTTLAKVVIVCLIVYHFFS